MLPQENRSSLLLLWCLLMSVNSAERLYNYRTSLIILKCVTLFNVTRHLMSNMTADFLFTLTDALRRHQQRQSLATVPLMLLMSQDVISSFRIPKSRFWTCIRACLYVSACTLLEKEIYNVYNKIFFVFPRRFFRLSASVLHMPVRHPSFQRGSRGSI